MPRLATQHKLCVASEYIRLQMIILYFINQFDYESIYVFRSMDAVNIVCF